MNQEIMVLKGRLATARHRLKDLDLEASGLITLIRVHLNPWEGDVTALKIPEAAAAMARLVAIHEEMAGLKARIAEMEEALA